MKVIDIETIPQPGIMDTWFPEWARKKMPNATDAEIELSACLHGEFGMVCAIGMLNTSDPKPCHVIATDFESERAALEALANNLAHSETLVGHNIKNFDIPFLAKRYMAHGIRVPATLRTAGKKPWEIPHHDTMEIMRFAGDCSMSLRSACHLLGLGDPKAQCSGGEVYDLFKAGRTDLIGRYVESDVSYEFELFKKLLDLAMV
mgnify:CR=1 FL=1